jgi:hypothetical protein
MKINIKQE